MAATSLVLWIPIVAGVQFLGRRYGRGDLRVDFGITFTKSDAWGVPAGIASQLLLVTAVTWPFTQWFPEEFSSDKIEQRARELIDAAHSGWIIVLALVVVIGAPFVEELTYRGLLQGSLVRRIQPRLALLIVAIFLRSSICLLWRFLACSRLLLFLALCASGLADLECVW